MVHVYTVVLNNVDAIHCKVEVKIDHINVQVVAFQKVVVHSITIVMDVDIKMAGKVIILIDLVVKVQEIAVRVTI